MPTMGFDYNFSGDGSEAVGEENFNRVTDVVSLVLKDFKTGALWAHTAECKGPRDEWLSVSSQTSRVQAMRISASRLTENQPRRRRRQPSLA